MSEPASNLDAILPVTTEGLDDLFEAEVLPGPTTDYQVGPTEGVPVDQAAKVLGLSVKTIKDRLRKGTLSGFKKRDRFGEKWMVCLDVDYQVVPGPTDQDYQVVPGPTEPSSELQALLTVLENKDRELQAAAFRNGYLEAQLAERDQQIKLLNDSQHKPGWWARFTKWCVGQ